MILFALVRDDVRYTLRESSCGVWMDNVGREVRCAVVQCDDLERTGARSSWAVTIRLEDCCRVASHDEQARQLPVEIEARTVALLRAATRAAS